MPGKLGKTTEQRLAILRNQASQLLWYGRLETTAARAKELRPYVEKLITKAVNTYDDVVEYEVVAKDKKGKEVKATAVKDGPKRLAARRAIMAKTYDLQEVKPFNEKKSDFKKRTGKVQQLRLPFFMFRKRGGCGAPFIYPHGVFGAFFDSGKAGGMPQQRSPRRSGRRMDGGTGAQTLRIGKNRPALFEREKCARHDPFPVLFYGEPVHTRAFRYFSKFKMLIFCSIFR